MRNRSNENHDIYCAELDLTNTQEVFSRVNLDKPTDDEILQFYNDHIRHKTCRQDNGELIHAFIHQLEALLNKFNAWALENQLPQHCQISDNVINGIVESFHNRKAGRMPYQSDLVFEALKIRLEEIYYILWDASQSEMTKTHIAENLLKNINVCGPGMYTRVVDAHTSCYQQSTLPFWLANFRTTLIKQLAEAHIQRKSISSGNSVHVHAALIQYANNNGWSLLNDLGSLQDNFNHLTLLTVKDLEVIHKNFKRRYAAEASTEVVQCFKDQLTRIPTHDYAEFVSRLEPLLATMGLNNLSFNCILAQDGSGVSLSPYFLENVDCFVLYGLKQLGLLSRPKGFATKYYPEGLVIMRGKFVAVKFGQRTEVDGKLDLFFHRDRYCLVDAGVVYDPKTFFQKNSYKKERYIHYFKKLLVDVIDNSTINTIFMPLVLKHAEKVPSEVWCSIYNSGEWSGELFLAIAEKSANNFENKSLIKLLAIAMRHAPIQAWRQQLVLGGKIVSTPLINVVHTLLSSHMLNHLNEVLAKVPVDAWTIQLSNGFTPLHQLIVMLVNHPHFHRFVTLVKSVVSRVTAPVWGIPVEAGGSYKGGTALRDLILVLIGSDDSTIFEIVNIVIKKASRRAWLRSVGTTDNKFHNALSTLMEGLVKRPDNPQLLTFAQQVANWYPAESLFLAAERGILNLVKYILHKNSAHLNTVNPDGDTALKIAAEKGHIEIMVELLMRGAKLIHAWENLDQGQKDHVIDDLMVLLSSQLTTIAQLEKVLLCLPNELGIQLVKQLEAGLLSFSTGDALCHLLEQCQYDKTMHAICTVFSAQLLESINSMEHLDRVLHVLNAKNQSVVLHMMNDKLETLIETGQHLTTLLLYLMRDESMKQEGLVILIAKQHMISDHQQFKVLLSYACKYAYIEHIKPLEARLSSFILTTKEFSEVYAALKPHGWKFTLKLTEIAYRKMNAGQVIKDNQQTYINTIDAVLNRYGPESHEYLLMLEQVKKQIERKFLGFSFFASSNPLHQFICKALKEAFINPKNRVTSSIDLI